MSEVEAVAVELSNATTRSDEETMAFARELGRRLRPGDVVVLSGPIGAGKTYFAKGLAEGLGVDSADVNSPTYDLVHEFDGPAAHLVHMDMYRLDVPSDDDIEWAREYIDGRNIVIIEWGERIVRHIADEFYTVSIAFADSAPDARAISITRSAGGGP